MKKYVRVMSMQLCIHNSISLKRHGKMSHEAVVLLEYCLVVCI